jgi:hypothetical protein
VSEESSPSVQPTAIFCPSVLRLVGLATVHIGPSDISLTDLGPDDPGPDELSLADLGHSDLGPADLDLAIICSADLGSAYQDLLSSALLPCTSLIWILLRGLRPADLIPFH